MLTLAAKHCFWQIVKDNIVKIALHKGYTVPNGSCLFDICLLLVMKLLGMQWTDEERENLLGAGMKFSDFEVPLHFRKGAEPPGPVCPVCWVLAHWYRVVAGQRVMISTAPDQPTGLGDMSVGKAPLSGCFWPGRVGLSPAHPER